jgi:predicted Fe-S protein YdhL (DUF1289 family)
MVKSPCTNICTMSSDGKLCMGCGRTIEEITNWYYFSNEEKKKIIKKIFDKSILKKTL